ncbi:MAG: hybrid sensor histidine kinase/response regulator, partial [Betaproteobacteria bacterium]|nr:hybrid sensor histidine kinase/response regulator [Betaproteobacteria bacterium]
MPSWLGLSGTEVNRTKPLVVGVCVLIVVMAWSVTALEVWFNRQEAIASQTKNNSNLAKSFQEQINRLLATVDQATIRLSDEVIKGDISKNDYVRFANETGLVPNILTQLSWVNAQGIFEAGNLDTDRSKTGPIDLSQREHIKSHLDAQTKQSVLGQFSKGGLFIGKPVLGKVSKKWTIQLSRVIERQGNNLGVVVASLNPNYIEEIFASVDLGSEGAVSLFGDDRVIRARVVGGQATEIGGVVPNNSGLQESLVQKEGNYVRVSGVDSKERIIAYHRVGDFPLAVFVSTTTQEALVEWRTSAFAAVLLCLAFTLAVSLATLMLLASLRHMEDQNSALKASEQRALSANKAKSEFLAAISHELRTPLTSIRGFAELLEARLEKPNQKEQAGLIRRGAEHLNSLLSEILDFAKAETGAMAITLEPSNVRTLVKSCTDLFGVTAASKNLEFRVQVNPDVPEKILCDGLRLKQILNNLLSNALKFTQNGYVALEVSVTTTHISFSVVDTGPGIPEHKHEIVFEKFRQADERVSYEHGGTGLGLALS